MGPTSSDWDLCNWISWPWEEQHWQRNLYNCSQNEALKIIQVKIK